MKTFKFTTLPDGYWLAYSNLRDCREGPFQTFDELKTFVKNEVGDGRKLFAWLVNNGTAHVLSVKVSSFVQS